MACPRPRTTWLPPATLKLPLWNSYPPNTRRAYESDVNAFVLFCGVETPAELRIVTRAHIVAWRGVLEAQELAPATIRRKLSAVSSLFDYLCNENAVEHNPVSGVKRPAADNNEGKTPALSDAQARKLLQAPAGLGLKARRDRAIMATYLFHALRRSELASLKVGSLQERRGVMHLTVFGKGCPASTTLPHRVASRKNVTEHPHGNVTGGPSVFAA